MTSNNLRRRLPIGIQTFREIREDGHLYVDKTAFALQLIEEGKHYFLSRPRRFGKSLFVSMLVELFECNRELFAALAIESHWNWSKSHPVIRLDFGGGRFRVPGGLDDNLMVQLRSYERRLNTSLVSRHGPDRFAELLEFLHGTSGRRVVVLVDEYDKPILDVLANPDLALENREYLRDLYSVIKSSDEHVYFFFVTGITKFSKVNLFSGLNSLEDITLAPRYSSICGYTEDDLDTVFPDEMEGLDREQVRDWYNGYSWRGSERVYNLWDILLLLRNREFRAWWYETGTPTFLADTVVERGVLTAGLDGLLTTGERLSEMDIGGIGTEALLFQTGYLTVWDSEEDDGNCFYRLGYPNREVRQSLNKTLLNALVPNWSGQIHTGRQVRKQFRAADLEALRRSLEALFAGIPHDWHRRNEIAHYRGYYASVFYSFFTGLGLDVRVEDSSSTGRLDMVVQAYGQVYLLEFKVREQAGPGSAMVQLKARRYADKYCQPGPPVHLLGVEFSAKTRNLVAFDVESL